MRRHPLQNRVTPFGEIVAIRQRGTFTGNCGIIHDPTTKTLLNRRWATKAWLTCVCDYRGRRRDVMAGRSWTELFFLDEAVALAAGHRPCFLCRRQDAEAFRNAWSKAAGTVASAAEIDAVLHRERVAPGGRQVLHDLPMLPYDLPDGTFVVQGGRAYLVVNGLGFPWAPDGYGSPIDPQHAEAMLTPPSTVAALMAGYEPSLHPTLAAGSSDD